jgi:hypothetical protein
MIAQDELSILKFIHDIGFFIIIIIIIKKKVKNWKEQEGERTWHSVASSTFHMPPSALGFLFYRRFLGGQKVEKSSKNKN